MYVCLCNGFTDKQVRAVADEPNMKASRVYRRLGCRPQCGKCIGVLRDLVDECRAAPAPDGGSSEEAA